MIVWINGAFGGGKTHTAHEIHRRLPGSVICDPEFAGFGLNRMIPRALRGDFQDLPVWRTSVHHVLDMVASRTDGVVLVPMTLVSPRYFSEIVGRLRSDGHEVRHFSLLAPREVVLRRLSERVFGHAFQLLRGGRITPRRESWAARKVDLCLSQLRKPEFAEHIWNDKTPLPAVADKIASSCGLTLTPNTDSALRAQLRRATVGIKHIRLD
ncbi:AAA family ATPase [Actinocrispum sp. NPDC049592]|uniref:AAA family ATPase n=1 Tax=Actinocrispum sp. NPDC049592 TaxID=3154835 RepID=UPI003431C8C4